MAYGNIDLQDLEYMIIYSEPGRPEIINTWTLPDGSFQLNYELMINRGCIIHNVFHRMSEKDLLETMIKN